MTLDDIVRQAKAKFGSSPTTTLSFDESTDQLPMELLITDEHSEHFLSLKTSGDTDRGLLTGLMALGSIPCLLIALWQLAIGNYEGACNVLIVAVPLIVPPFLWETIRRLPLPIIFNRRTREIYYVNNGKLYHAPWDGLKALTCEFQIIGPYTAGMTNASLEILVHQFGNHK